MATGELLRNAKEALSYEPETGRFTWLISSGSVKAGDEAGTAKTSTYARIKLSGKLVSAHRLAWAMHFGSFPDSDIDHINGNPKDNRIGNLRLASDSQNQANRRVHKPTKSGVKGVNWNGRMNKWVARCAMNGRRVHLGYFSDSKDAELAYQQAAQVMHGDFYYKGN